jgi:hypothetical protein
MAGCLPGIRDTTPLVQICAQVDYVDTLQGGLKGQQALSKQVHDEFKALVEQCRAALRSRGYSYWPMSLRIVATC